MNVQAWIERATQRTVGKLREDIDATELLARLEGRSPSKLDPLDDDTRDAVDDIERTVIGTITGLTETPVSQQDDQNADQTGGQLLEQNLEQMSGTAPEAGPTTLHLSLTEATGQF